MNITEVRIKLMHHRSDRLRAFASITIDNDFVVHDLRVIEGRNGFFVAMPSRKLSDSCAKCGAKNELRARFCANCGARLDESRTARGPHPRDKFHVDVAHPINTACREMLQHAVLAAYREEEERSARGLAPSSDYSLEGLEELAEEYSEPGGEEPTEARRDEQPDEEPPTVTEPGLQVEIAPQETPEPPDTEGATEGEAEEESEDEADSDTFGAGIL